LTLEAAPRPGEAYLPQMKTLLTKVGDLADYAGKAAIGLATFAAYTRNGALQVTATSAIFYVAGLSAIAAGLYLQQEAQK
jgi:hypothetical protein